MRQHFVGTVMFCEIDSLLKIICSLWFLSHLCRKQKHRTTTYPSTHLSLSIIVSIYSVRCTLKQNIFPSLIINVLQESLCENSHWLQCVRRLSCLEYIDRTILSNLINFWTQYDFLKILTKSCFSLLIFIMQRILTFSFIIKVFNNKFTHVML